MPVINHDVHDKTKIAVDTPYGCHNRPHQFRPICHGADCYGLQIWPFANSHDCRYDMSLSDVRCNGCHHRGSGEQYAANLRDELMKEAA